MQLTEVQSLTADYQSTDLDEMAAVMQSTFHSSPSTAIRWGKVNPAEAQEWLRKVFGSGLTEEFKLPRIASMEGNPKLTSSRYAEHLVVRDLDLEHKEASCDLSPGHIVAHADFRYHQSYKSSPDKGDSEQTTTSFPSGADGELQLLVDGMVETRLDDLFGGLPCFELHGISTLSPSHLRKGIAKRLVEWIFPYADRFNVPVILSASPLGLFVYRKCGFEEYRKYDIVIDLARWGSEDVHRHVIMVRWPREVERLPEGWKEWRDKHTAG